MAKKLGDTFFATHCRWKESYKLHWQQQEHLAYKKSPSAVPKSFIWPNLEELWESGCS